MTILSKYKHEASAAGRSVRCAFVAIFLATSLSYDGFAQPVDFIAAERVGNTLSGTWVNELNSTMVLTQEEGGLLSGTYRTIVGNAEYWYVLVGATNLNATSNQAAVGFTVVWNNEAYGDSHSVITWSGQYQNVDSEEYIRTTWLLTSETPVASNWASTQIGMDTFTRVK